MFCSVLLLTCHRHTAGLQLAVTLVDHSLLCRHFTRGDSPAGTPSRHPQHGGSLHAEHLRHIVREPKLVYGTYPHSSHSKDEYGALRRKDAAVERSTPHQQDAWDHKLQSPVLYISISITTFMTYCVPCYVLYFHYILCFVHCAGGNG